MGEQIIKYNSEGNLIYYKDSDGDEFWCDDMGNYIYFKNSTGYEEWWRKYDENNNHFFYLTKKYKIKWKKNLIFTEYRNKIIFY
jgi:hypothetical protein